MVARSLSTIFDKPSQSSTRRPAHAACPAPESSLPYKLARAAASSSVVKSPSLLVHSLTSSARPYGARR